MHSVDAAGQPADKADNVSIRGSDLDHVSYSVGETTFRKSTSLLAKVMASQRKIPGHRGEDSGQSKEIAMVVELGDAFQRVWFGPALSKED